VQIQAFLRRNQGRLGVSLEGGNWDSFLGEMSRSDLFERSGETWGLRSEQDVSFESDEKCRDEDEDYGEESKIEPKSRSSVGRRGNDSRSFWCHQCKQKHYHVYHCAQGCNKKYCGKCLQRHYNEKESDIDPESWVCVYCRDLCTCASCRKKKAKDSNTKFESRRGKKRNARQIQRGGGKRRRLDQTDSGSGAEFDSEEFVEEDEEEYCEEEEDYYVTSSPAPTPMPVSQRISANPVSTTPIRSSNNKRITLKTLLDAGLLADGDIMFFKKSGDFSGILLSDGQIACDGHICTSLSTFAKYAASELNTKWSRQNGWRLVFCRSKSLYDLRKEYMENFLELETEREVEVEENLLRPTYRNSARSCAKNISNMYEEDSETALFDCEELSEDSKGDYSLPILPSLYEEVQVAPNYNWLKYELQHALEYVHGAPVFEGSCPQYDMDELHHMEIHSVFSYSEFDIRDKDFFPITCDAGAKCY